MCIIHMQIIQNASIITRYQFSHFFQRKHHCTIHHVDGVIDLIENTAQAKVIFLPPYSPDLMPLEEVFSKVKSTMKMNDKMFQVCSASRALLAIAFSYITAQDCIGYIRHSGYICGSHR